MDYLKKSGAVLLCSLILAGGTTAGKAQTNSYAVQEVQDAQPNTSDLQQLVAPVALYPDALVGQILAASTYPAQVVQAHRWLQDHTNLTGQRLAQEVNKQTWDVSVRALTQFPDVLANLDKNLAWTSALGEAYVRQPQAVLDAIQTMRGKARDAGNLNDTPQENVTTEGQTIIIQPANPEVVYVPTYNPWLVYGSPIPVYPDWYPYGGLYVGTPGISFGLGFGIGFFAGYGWGYHHWDADWHRHEVVFNRSTYINHSTTFYRNGGSYRGNSSYHGNPSYNSGNLYRENNLSHGNNSYHGGTVSSNRGGYRSGGYSSFSRPYSAPHFSYQNRSGSVNGFGYNQSRSVSGYAPRGGGNFGGSTGGGYRSSVGGFHGSGSAGGGFHSGGYSGGGFSHGGGSVGGGSHGGGRR